MAPEVSAAPAADALALWWRGARPRTLGAGLVPVVLGTAAAGEVIWWRFAAALVVGAGLQVGVNFANDYFDGVRGVDTHERLGPPRLTASGAASPRAVLAAALVALGRRRRRRTRARARDRAGADPGRRGARADRGACSTAAAPGPTPGSASAS